MRTSYIDRMLTQSMALVEKVVNLDVGDAVIDLPESLIRKTDKAIALCYSEVHRNKNKEFIQKIVRWIKTWKKLKTVLHDGWNIQAARAQALAAHTYLRTIAQIYQEIRKEENSSKLLRYWPGDPLISQTREALREMKKNKNMGLKKLFSIIKQALLLQERHEKQEAILDFFCMVARSEYKTSFAFLEVMTYDEKDLMDVALISILAKCPLDGIVDSLSFLTKFSSPDKVQEGIQTLFRNCIEKDSEIAHLLIKKMHSRAARNDAYGQLSLACARKGQIEKALAFSQMITAVVLKRGVDLKILSFTPNKNPIYMGGSPFMSSVSARSFQSK